jgi:hypothetical protein
MPNKLDGLHLDTTQYLPLIFHFTSLKSYSHGFRVFGWVESDHCFVLSLSWRQYYQKPGIYSFTMHLLLSMMQVVGSEIFHLTETNQHTGKVPCCCCINQIKCWWLIVVFLLLPFLHSFIIALNTDYEGGGTYIHVLRRAMKPTVAGGMISFCGGELLHSGDTVVKGIRYIIVAFCYIDLASFKWRETRNSDHGPEAINRGILFRLLSVNDLRTDSSFTNYENILL